MCCLEIRRNIENCATAGVKSPESHQDAPVRPFYALLSCILGRHNHALVGYAVIYYACRVQRDRCRRIKWTAVRCMVIERRYLFQLFRTVYPSKAKSN